MLLKQLEYFVCVVDNNSFTQAATENMYLNLLYLSKSKLLKLVLVLN